MNTRLEFQFLTLMSRELAKATSSFEPIHSSHEGYAIIKEELDEFWEVVKDKNHKFAKKQELEELVQTATMCWRTAIDIGLIDK